MEQCSLSVAHNSLVFEFSYARTCDCTCGVCGDGEIVGDTDDAVNLMVEAFDT